MIRGEEATLQRLQDEWPLIAAQTAWRLEPLYSYNTESHHNSNDQSTQQASNSVQPIQHVELPVINLHKNNEQ